MSPPRCQCRGLASLRLYTLILACVVVCTSAETPSPPTGPEESGWSLVPNRLKELVEPMVTRTRDRWQWFWGSGTALQGFMQTYYEDHLKGLGSRTQAWIQSSKDSLLNKTLYLCPRLLCRSQAQD